MDEESLKEEMKKKSQKPKLELKLVRAKFGEHNMHYNQFGILLKLEEIKND